MPLPIEDYALIGDTQSAGLVGKDGSIDWLCLPRFDSGACFAALLGTPAHGRFLIAPSEPVLAVRRRYRPGTLLLETEMTTASGTVRLVDCMAKPDGNPRLIRVVEGVQGRVPMHVELIVRYDYGSVVPWVYRVGEALHATAGPDALVLYSPVETHGQDLTTVADFIVGAGDRVPFSLIWHPSFTDVPRASDAFTAVEETEAWWRAWSSTCRYKGHCSEVVMSSLVVLKALTYAHTGGIVAAPTMSLPEMPGGVRNWDYRYCWLRDATFTLLALMNAGYKEEATRWCDWLLLAIAGDPAQLQILYGVAGERRIEERDLTWLPGYFGARPVRQGNGAVAQFQLDVYGEVMDAVHQARKNGITPSAAAWQLQKALIRFVEKAWVQPDESIWEVRGPRRHFTFSKVMAWVAVDRAIKDVESFGLEGPLDAWRKLRATIHEDVCRNGYNAQVGSFVQSYGSTRLDASLLMIPQLGFLPPDDPRVVSSVLAIHRDLAVDGFIVRYRTDEDGKIDGLPAGEGAFLACTLWLADAYALMGREQEAQALFERVMAVRNDVGLLAEELDPRTGRQLGNFPQAFSHVALVNTVFNLSRDVEGPAQVRQQ